MIQVFLNNVNGKSPRLDLQRKFLTNIGLMPSSIHHCLLRPPSVVTVLGDKRMLSTYRVCGLALVPLKVVVT